jgi:ABC-type transporter Mla subunit MlaD
MTAPANRWKLGLFVVAGLTASIGGLTWIGMRELKKASHVAYAYFDEAVTGLEEGSPVRFRGVTIGVVDEIRAAPDQRHLEVRAALYDDKLRKLGLGASGLDGECPLPNTLRAQIVMSWVTGTSFIQVDFFPDPPTGPQMLPFPVEDGRRTLRTVKSTAKSLEDASRDVLRELPLMATSAREIVELLRTEIQGARIGDLSRDLQALLQRCDDLVADAQKRGLVAGSADAITAIRDAAKSIQDERGPLGLALADLRALVKDLQAEVVAARVAETAAGVRGATNSIATLGGEAQRELAQLHRTLVSIEQLMTALERDPASLLRGRAASPSPLENK